MKQTIILFTTLALLAATLAGCKKEEIPRERSEYLKYKKLISNLRCPFDMLNYNKLNNEASIIGKWLLIKKWAISDTINGGLVFDTIDVSCDRVCYEFKKNGILTISGNNDDLHEGSYKYSYQLINNCSLCLPSPNLYISGGSALYCILTNFNMIITNKNKQFIRID